MVDKLKSAESIKLAILQHEMAELQKDMDKINELGHLFNELTRDFTNPIEFLLKFRQIYEQIEILIAKPFKSTLFSLTSSQRRCLSL